MLVIVPTISSIVAVLSVSKVSTFSQLKAFWDSGGRDDLPKSFSVPRNVIRLCGDKVMQAEAFDQVQLHKVCPAPNFLF